MTTEQTAPEQATIMQLAAIIRASRQGGNPTFCALSGLRLGLALSQHEPAVAERLYAYAVGYLAERQGWPVSEAWESDEAAVKTAIMPGLRKVPATDTRQSDKDCPSAEHARYRAALQDIYDLRINDQGYMRPTRSDDARRFASAVQIASEALTTEGEK